MLVRETYMQTTLKYRNVEETLKKIQRTYNYPGLKEIVKKVLNRYEIYISTNFRMLLE